MLNPLFADIFYILATAGTIAIYPCAYPVLNKQYTEIWINNYNLGMAKNFSYAFIHYFVLFSWQVIFYIFLFFGLIDFVENPFKLCIGIKLPGSDLLTDFQ